jgi:biopolymer transport protein ExbD
MAKGKKYTQQKDVRVDFTPMVDMNMLLITFFMLCTTLAKPQAMQLTMPSNDDTKNLNEEDKQVTKASHTITLYLGSNDKVWYIAGLPNYDDPSCVKETTYGKDGIEKVLNEHTTEEGINPIAKIKLAKKELDAKKNEYNSKMTDEQYQEALKKLKKGELPSGEKVPTMTVIIRPLNTATYENMVAALDEMLISNIDKYVIDNVDKMSDDDKALIEKAGVK